MLPVDLSIVILICVIWVQKRMYLCFWAAKCIILHYWLEVNRDVTFRYFLGPFFRFWIPKSLLFSKNPFKFCWIWRKQNSLSRLHWGGSLTKWTRRTVCSLGPSSLSTSHRPGSFDLGDDVQCNRIFFQQRQSSTLRYSRWRSRELKILLRS